jgi:hypothetical protein
LTQSLLGYYRSSYFDKQQQKKMWVFELMPLICMELECVMMQTSRRRVMYSWVFTRPNSMQRHNDSHAKRKIVKRKTFHNNSKSKRKNRSRSHAAKHTLR